MKIKRTANAGVLIETGGMRFLIDGVCKKILNYEETPQDIKDELCAQFPDVVMFTHYHDDHYDKEFSLSYTQKTLRSVYGPEFALCGKMGNVKIKGVPTRHIGKADIAHVSYILQGEKCLWFMGDASPLDAKSITEPKPDILIVPYAYVTTKSSWEITKSLGAKHIILLHMPPKDKDEYMLWQAMEETIGKEKILIPVIGEEIEL
ncbi:MAG: MBL fold metallo-hydrolase [Clostridia bacterium]|nr:MBL fold metallo-hydrolase [Clostridia bacterium]